MFMIWSCCLPLQTITRVMEEFPKNLGPDEYLVAVLCGGSGYLYHLLLTVGGHDDALQTCLCEHKAMNRPVGVAFWAVGGCKEEGCDCGGKHIRHRTYYPPTSTGYEQ
jgi:hypothetical protein